MRNAKAWGRLLSGLLAASVFSGSAWSQSTLTPDQEYQKLIKVNEDIAPLGANPFGENISPYDGALSFEETDVSLTGNGPALVIARSLSTTSPLSFSLNAERPFGDWDLNVPRIETATVAQGTTAGWITAGNPIIGQRCSQFSAPPDTPATQGGNSWSAAQWWYGYHLIVPGAGSQELLGRSASNSLAPAAGTAAYEIVTKQNWMITCTASNSADDGGQGFIALAPDGTQYTFTHLVYRPMSAITTPLGTSPATMSAITKTTGLGGVQPMVATSNILYRNDAFMYVTEVVDRFGNSLTYAYDSPNGTGNLSSITASDGRSITVNYDSTGYLITSITANASNVSSRTWKYTYDTTTNSSLPTLTGVTLPDGSAWSYNLAAFQTDAATAGSGDCTNNTFPLMTSPVTSATGTITHPSGLTGTFALAMLTHAHSYVLKACWGVSGSSDLPYYEFPEYNDQPTITSKSFSGAGIPAETWTYSYSSPNQSNSSDACYASGTCPSTVYTDVVDPNGNDVRYTYSNRWGVTDGQLLSTTYYAGTAGGTVLRTESNVYASPTTGPWPSTVGNDPQGRHNTAQTTELAPLQQRQTNEEGDTYTWQAVLYDAYAHPTDVKRYNSINSQTPIEETTTFLNDPNLWVLGLTQTVVNNTTGETELSNTYYTSTDLLQTRSRFGEQLMSYTYNNAGQLASFIDGNGYATNLGNYYRGIPQSITYEDGTYQSLVVDDLGQIRSITDQARNTTSYDYDAMGRIAKITFPANDEIGWYPQTFNYDFVGSERGIAGNHWRRTMRQGDKAEITYFDATLRPILASHYRASDGALAITTQTNYDWKGNSIFQSYPADGSPNFNTLSAGTSTTYDALSRVTQKRQSSELGPLTTRIGYLQGAVQQVTDPKGNVSTTSYQVFDQPSYGAAIQIAAPEGVLQTITRDLYGNPISITQSAQSTGSPSRGLIGTGPVFKPGASTTKNFYYDSYHRLCRTSEPESGSTIIAYDNANNIDWTADGIAITSGDCGTGQVNDTAKTYRIYDVMNRLTVLEPPAGTQGTTYEYDAVGNVTHARSGIAHWAGTYNKRNMPLSESLTANGFSNTLHYTHDSYGNLSATLYPDGTNVAYAPDVFGRPTQAGSFASNVSYEANGEIAHIALSNGADYVTEQNTRQLLSHYSYIKGNVFNVSEDLAYDLNGNITSFTDLINGQRDKTLSYDGLNRLTQAQASALWGAESYTYDVLNNLTSRTFQGQSIIYGYDLLNHLTSIAYDGGATTSLGYDTRGNIINKNGNTLAFDAKNQLMNAPGFASYAYDADGRRVLKQAANGGLSTYYFYTHSGRLLYQYDEDLAKGTSYIYLGNKLIARNERYESAIRGQVDGVVIDSNDNAVINGWACSTGLTQSIQVQVYVGGPSGRGALMGVYGANQASEPAVATECGVSNGSFRFSIPLSATVRSDHVEEKIYIYGLSPVGNSNDELGNSGEFIVPAEQKAPKPPSINAGKTFDGKSIAISWSTAVGVTAYHLEQQFNDARWVEIYTGTATTYTINAAANGTYRFRVQACNTYGCGDWGASSDVRLENVPNAPASISVPGSSYGPVPVSWASSFNATSYSVERSINGAGWSVVYDGGSTSVSIAVSTSGSYTYRVRAWNTYGYSGYTTSSAVVVTVPPAYAPNLNVPGTSTNGAYTVSWSGVNDANRYTLQEQFNGGGWNTVQDNGATNWSTGGRGNGTYGYRVVACNNAGCGPWSGTASTTVTLLPSPPGSISVPAQGTYPVGSWVVSFAPVSGATSYNLRRTTLSTGLAVVIYTGPGTSIGDGGLVPGQYQYSVNACNAAGCSGWLTQTGSLTVICSAGGTAVTVGAVSPQLIKCP